MGNHGRGPSERRRRVWLIALAGAAIVIAAIVILAVIRTDSVDEVPEEAAAQKQCEPQILKQVISPSSAKLLDIKTAQSALDPDSRDLFPLMFNEPLKGVETSRIAVWEVSGVVEVPSEVGTMLHDPFVCRAYFVDGKLVDTQVAFKHDH